MAEGGSAETDEPREVVCTDCDEQPALVEDPYGSGKYLLVCDCAMRSIDVNEAVKESALTDIPTGAWSNFDAGEISGYGCNRCNINLSWI